MPRKTYPAKISTTLLDDDLETIILDCSAVRRPLFIPSMLEIYGEVLSHSAALCVTSQGAFLVEFMWDNIVYVKKLDNYKSGQDFDFEGFHFIYDSYIIQVPQMPVTVKMFATTMAIFMAGKKFDVFTHNCHHARYYTMKRYGMSSKNPKKVKRNILYQGIVDFFFRPYINKKKIKKEKSSNDLETELTTFSENKKECNFI